MIDSDLADYLQANGIGTVGSYIFIGELPLNADNCLAVIVSPSPDPDKSIPYYTQTIDIWCRTKNYIDGYQKLKEIFDLLHQQEHFEIGDYHIYLAYAMGMVEYLDRDVERRHLFKLTLSFLYREDS